MSIYEDVRESPAVVSVDWFALSCMLSHPYDGRPFVVPAGWSVVECTSTAVWHCRYFIMDNEGNKVATILTKPKSSIIDERRAVIEIANQWLYHEDFRKIVDMVLESYPMDVTGLNRVDLCADFNMTARQYSIFRMLQDGTAYLKGVRRGADWHEWKRRIKDAHQQSWGGRDSVFHWKMYYKYKELHEGGVESSKPYIEAMWRAEGLDVKHVWRLECSVTSSNSLEKVDGSGRLGVFDWYDKRAEIFSSLYNDKFVIRENQGHKDARHDPILYFFLRDEGDIGEGKMLRHGAANSLRESDSERRVVCKMWKEFRDDEVRANDFLVSNIREFLVSMCQKASCVNAICRRFNLSESEVISILQNPD